MTRIDFAYFNYEHDGLIGGHDHAFSSGRSHDFADLVRVAGDGGRWPHILIMGFSNYRASRNLLDLVFCVADMFATCRCTQPGHGGTPPSGLYPDHQAEMLAAAGCPASWLLFAGATTGIVVTAPIACARAALAGPAGPWPSGVLPASAPLVRHVSSLTAL